LRKLVRLVFDTPRVVPHVLGVWALTLFKRRSTCSFSAQVPIPCARSLVWAGSFLLVSLFSRRAFGVCFRDGLIDLEDKMMFLFRAAPFG